MRIHIIGNSGSGKSYLAEELHSMTSLPHYDLDDVYWDNTADHYGTKHPPLVRDAILSDLLLHDEWIVEGIYDTWVTNSFQQADIILFLDFPLKACKQRVILRFIKRKLGLLEDKKESISSLFTLLSWMKQYDKIKIPSIQEGLKQYSDKVVYLHNQTEITQYLDSYKAIAG